MPTPPDQRFLNITFALTGGGDTVRVMLTVRPEDFTYSDPSRFNVTQTLGGAWADDWGAGLGTITLNGNTGWRGSFLLSGVDEFMALRYVVLDQWRARRQQMVASGSDPDQVQLLYSDSLNQIVKVVAPQTFVLRRSKSRPLLYNYSLPLTVLADATDQQSLLDQITGALNNPLRWLAGVTGLGDAVLDAQYFVQEAVSVVSSIGSAITGFVNIGVGLIQSVASVASTVEGVFTQAETSILNVGQTYSMAANNLFAALGATPGLTAQQAAPLMKMTTIFGGAACLIRNSFNTQPLYPNYDALVGASFCSSTGGGDPPSQYAPGANPWADIVPATTPPVTVTPAAHAALVTAAAADPLSLVGQNAAIGAQMATISTGITLAP